MSLAGAPVRWCDSGRNEPNRNQSSNHTVSFNREGAVRNAVSFQARGRDGARIAATRRRRWAGDGRPIGSVVAGELKASPDLPGLFGRREASAAAHLAPHRSSFVLATCVVAGRPNETKKRTKQSAIVFCFVLSSKAHQDACLAWRS